MRPLSSARDTGLTWISTGRPVDGADDTLLGPAGSPRAPATDQASDLVGRVFRGSTAVRSGRLTRHQLHSSAWRRLFPDVYACASLDVTHELRTFAVTRVLLPGAVACGRSAATVWGVELTDPDAPVECVVPRDAHHGAVAGVHLQRTKLPAELISTRRDIPVTSPMRTALDLARIRPLDDAVVALDRFLAPGLVFLTEVRAAAANVTGRDCRHVQHVAELADGLAGSPQETRLRLLIDRSDLPRPVAQHTVRIEGRWVGRVDFAWPEHKLALEYEGLWHGAHQQVARDRRRLNGLTRAGWRVIFVTAADLHDPVRLLARLAEALAAPRSA